MAPYPNWRQVAKTSRHRKRRFEHHYLAAVATKPIADVSLSSAAKTGRMRCSDSAWTDLQSNCLLQYLKRAVSIIVGASGSACERIELHCTRAEANRRVASPWK
jgi:hypothetical protein